MARQAEHVFHAVENLVGKGDLIWPVHLGFDHINRAFGGVRAAVMQGAEHGEHGVHQAFKHLLAIQRNGRGCHQVADIAHQHQGAAF